MILEKKIENKKMNDESELKLKLKFQDIYIRILESELFRIVGEKQIGIYRNEEDPSNEISIFLKSKFDAIYQSALSLQRKLDYKGKPSYEIPMSFDLEKNYNPPPSYSLKRIANISQSPLDVFHQQVILKWEIGEKEMGNALYMDEKCNIDMATVGYLIEKFFYDVCQSKIKLLKSEKF